MVVTGLSLNNFRSYTEAAFEFNPGVNIIVGPNASGKTNLLEAILLSCSGKSYRAKDVDLVQHGKPWMRIEADTDEGKRILTIERVDDPHSTAASKKKFKINTVDYKRLSLQKTIPVVLFEPEHLRLLSGSPERRREYLDNLLEQTTPGYAKLRRDYKRTLAQRNALLKSGRDISGTMFAWDIRLSELGGKIAKFRHDLVEDINKQIQANYRSISETKSEVKIEYKVDLSLEGYSSKMHDRLAKTLSTDCERGFTTTGPHRHDFELSLKGQTAAVTASRGEIRSILLSLKMIELELLEQSTGKSPLLLLDDVFSELDGARRKALTQQIAKYQTFITTTDADIVIHHFADKGNIIPLG